MKTKKPRSARAEVPPAVPPPCPGCGTPPHWARWSCSSGPTARRCTRRSCSTTSKQQLRPARRVGPALFLDRPGAPGVDVQLLGQYADFPGGHLLVSPLQYPDPHADRHSDLPGDSAAAGMGGGREVQPCAPFAAFGAVLFLLHPLQAESVAYISGRSDVTRGHVRLRLLCRLSLPALGRDFLGRRGLGGAPLRRRRAHQGTGRGPARPVSPDRPLVEPGIPAAQRARQLEAVRRAGGWAPPVA